MYFQNLGTFLLNQNQPAEILKFSQVSQFSQFNLMKEENQKYNYLCDIFGKSKISDIYSYNLQRRTTLIWDALQLSVKDKLMQLLERRFEISQSDGINYFIMPDLSLSQKDLSDIQYNILDLLIRENQGSIINYFISQILKNDETGHMYQIVLSYLESFSKMRIDIKPLLDSLISCFQISSEYY